MQFNSFNGFGSACDAEHCAVNSSLGGGLQDLSCVSTVPSEASTAVRRPQTARQSLDNSRDDCDTTALSVAASLVPRKDLSGAASAASMPPAPETRFSGSHFWVMVGRLDPYTTSKGLLDLFFPYGASEAFVLSGPIASSARRQGYVAFPAADMAGLAVAKMHQFIPCRQSSAITVERVTEDEVRAAKARDTSNPVAPCVPNGNIAELSMLVDMASTTPQHVAHFICTQPDPCAVARDIAVELDSATPATLAKYAEALASIMDTWPLRKELQTHVVRSLLAAILSGPPAAPNATSADNKDPHPTDAKTLNLRRTNAGALLGLLFGSHFVTGDPVEVARRLLRSEITDPSQLNGIFALIDYSAGRGSSRSIGEFWSTLAEITAVHPSPQVRMACSQRLASRLSQQRRGLSPDAEPFEARSASGAECAPVAGTSALSRRRAEEARSRTVYVSRLAVDTPAIPFRRLIDSCGSVHKIRVCREPGFSTLFGFVEMSSVGGAKALLKHDKVDLSGSQVRFQPAKMSIQDVEPDDAFEAPDGSILRICQFALFDGPTTTVAHKISPKPSK